MRQQEQYQKNDAERLLWLCLFLPCGNAWPVNDSRKALRCLPSLLASIARPMGICQNTILRPESDCRKQAVRPNGTCRKANLSLPNIALRKAKSVLSKKSHIKNISRGTAGHSHDAMRPDEDCRTECSAHAMAIGLMPKGQHIGAIAFLSFSDFVLFDKRGGEAVNGVPHGYIPIARPHFLLFDKKDGEAINVMLKGYTPIAKPRGQAVRSLPKGHIEIAGPQSFYAWCELALESVAERLSARWLFRFGRGRQACEAQPKGQMEVACLRIFPARGEVAHEICAERLRKNWPFRSVCIMAASVHRCTSGVAGRIFPRLCRPAWGHVRDAARLYVRCPLSIISLFTLSQFGGHKRRSRPGQDRHAGKPKYYCLAGDNLLRENGFKEHAARLISCLPQSRRSPSHEGGEPRAQASVPQGLRRFAHRGQQERAIMSLPKGFGNYARS